MFGEKIIYHIDVNSAFLSWEAVHRIHNLGANIDLRTIPSAVGGNVKKRHGIILAKSIPAKVYNIQTGEPVGEALRKCPELELVKPHYNLYESCSGAFMEILREYSPYVEQYSIDEAYMDMSGTEGLHGTPVATANLIKDRIYAELGFTVNIGISNNKLLAKMASDFKKPNLVHTLFPHDIHRKMWPLPVSELFYVGRATTKKLIKLGIRTVGELANADPEMLQYHFKSHGLLVWNFANGRDLSIVEETRPANKGYGNSITIAFDVVEPKKAKTILLSLCETVCTRLRKDNVVAQVVAIDIVYFDFSKASHQQQLITKTNITNEIHEATCILFDELWNGLPVRHLGVHTSKVSEYSQNRQYDFFTGDKFLKLEALEKALDTIREKHGEDAIKRATFVDKDAPVRHMTGGISKDKEKIDYSQEVIL